MVGGSIGQVDVQWEMSGDPNNDIVDHTGVMTFGNLIRNVFSLPNYYL